MLPLSNFFLLILTTFLLISCGTSRYISGSNSFVETFYAGETGTQYFIKPFKMKGENKNHLKLDITFRIKNEIRDSAICNFSIFSDKSITSIDSLQLVNFEKNYALSYINFMYVERSKKLLNSRFSCRIPLRIVRDFFKTKDFQIIAFTNNLKLTFNLNNKGKKVVSYVNYQIFDLFK